VIRYRSDALPRSQVKVKVDVAALGEATARYIAPTPAGLDPYHRSLMSRFVDSAAAPVLLSLVIALLAALAVVVFVRPRRSTLVERVREFAVGEREALAEAEAAAASANPVKQARRDRGVLSKLDRNLEIARIEMTAPRLVLLTLLGTALAIFVLALISPVFAVLGLLSPLMTRAVVTRKLRAVRDEFDEQLAPNLQVLASALRTGHSFTGALSVVVDNAREPSRSELRRAVSDERLGVPIEDAIRRVADRMVSRDLEQVALLAELQRTAGGNAAEVLDTVVETLRARADVRRLVKTLTAQGRYARWILSALPLAAGLLLWLLQPEAVRPLYDSGAGQIALVVAALLVTTGSLVIQKIVDIKV
jgi:Flp pilus assembly protein TadB